MLHSEQPKKESSAHRNFKNLQIFHLLDRILRVCYIPRVFRCIRLWPGDAKRAEKPLDIS